MVMPKYSLLTINKISPGLPKGSSRGRGGGVLPYVGYIVIYLSIEHI